MDAACRSRWMTIGQIQAFHAGCLDIRGQGHRVRLDARRAVMDSRLVRALAPKDRVRDARVEVYLKAVAVILDDPGAWYCLPCWGRVSGLVSPEDQAELWSLARTFLPRSEPGRPVLDVAPYEQPSHEGRRLALCVRTSASEREGFPANPLPASG